MTPCADCLHLHECMEQRGRCKEYKTLKEVKKDIEMLNKMFKSAGHPETADTAGQGHRPSGLVSTSGTGDESTDSGEQEKRMGIASAEHRRE